MPDSVETLESEGRVWFRSALDFSSLEALDALVPPSIGCGARLIYSPDAAGALRSANAIVERLMPGARPVRLVAFDKTEEQNWALPWHQDRVIAVRARYETEGFSNWSRKDGVWHVEPPIDLLQRMLFLRVFIDDDVGEEGGGLLIAVGTHALGSVSSVTVDQRARDARIEDCSARRGDILVAKALLLHRSRAVSKPIAGHRRALRIDYSADDLPLPLRWAVEI